MSDKEDKMNEDVGGDEEMAINDDDCSVHYEDVIEEYGSGNSENGDSAGEEEDNESQEDEEEETGPLHTYLPGKPLEEGEELVCDEKAYLMFHQANTGNICKNILLRLIIEYLF